MAILKTLGAATLYIVIVSALVFLLAEATDKQQPVTQTQHLRSIGAQP